MSGGDAPTKRRRSYIDVGANLTDGMFRGEYHGKTYHDPDLDVVLRRGWDAGVEKVMVTAGTLSEAREALELAERFDHPSAETSGADDEPSTSTRRLFTTVGVHPTRCGEFEASGDADAYLESLTAIAREHSCRKAGGRVVAVGECGLDYDRIQFCDPETQRIWFERQFEITRATGLPMFLHMRAAAEDFTAIVKQNLDGFNGGCVHSFTGTWEEARALLDLHPDIYVGINGCSLRTEESLEVVKKLPNDRIMIETDAPWCGIKPSHPGHSSIQTKWPAKDKKKRGGIDTGETVKDRSEPCHIAQVLEVLAAVKGEDADELAEIYRRNTLKLFFPEEHAAL
jgi:TatD DNase family protein